MGFHKEQPKKSRIGDSGRLRTLVPLEGEYFVTIQLTSDLPDSGVKSAHIHLYIARFILVLEQIRSNLNSYR